MSQGKYATIEVHDSKTLFEAVGDAYRRRKEKREREEREREHRQQKLERQERERALKEARQQWDAVLEELRAVQSGSSGIEQEFPKIALPDPPSLELRNGADAAAVLEDVAKAETDVARYQQTLAAAILSARRDRAAGEGSDKILEWYNAQAARTARGATVSLSNNEAWQGLHAKDKELRRNTLEQAREMMARLDSRIARIPAELGDRLDAVAGAASSQEAKTELQRLKAGVDETLQRVEERDRQRRKTIRAIQINRVAELMARSLEDMGYAVSGIGETAYAKGGHIVAYDPDQPGHAVRLTVDRETGEVASNLVKLMESDTDAGSRSLDESDEQATQAWCRPERFGNLVRGLKDKGVSAAFTQDPGAAQTIESVPINELLNDSPSLARYFERDDRRLRQRERPVEDR